MEVIKVRRWEPYTHKGLLDVLEASCCEKFILCHVGTEYFVKYRSDDRREWVTARGDYGQAFRAWQWLCGWHVHRKKVAS